MNCRLSRFMVAAGVLATLLAYNLQAQFPYAPPSSTSATDVTIIYDATLHEFTCWAEGRPTNAPVAAALAAYGENPGICPAAAPNVAAFYAYKDNGAYFFDGQTIWIALEGAHLGDLFTVQAPNTSLTEPSLPIFGQTTTLPLFSAFAPGPASGSTQAPAENLPPASGGASGFNSLQRVVIPPGQASSAPPRPPQPVFAADRLYADLNQGPPILQSHLQELNAAFSPTSPSSSSQSPNGSGAAGTPYVVINTGGSTRVATNQSGPTGNNPAASPAIPTQLPVQLTSPTLLPAVSYFDGRDPAVAGLPARIAALAAQINALRLHDVQCGTAMPNPDPLNTNDPQALLTDIASLTHIVESETALYQQLSAGQYSTFGQSLSTAVGSFNAVTLAQIQGQAAAFDQFRTTLQDAFADPQSGEEINNIAIGQPVPVSSTPFITASPTAAFRYLLYRVNLWTGGANPADTEPPSENPSVRNLQINLRMLREQEGDINAVADMFLQLSNRITALQVAIANYNASQNQLNVLGELTVNAARTANCRLENAPLMAPYNYFSVGVWYSSQTINVSLQQGARVPPFNLSSVNPLGAASSQPQSATGSPTGNGSPSGNSTGQGVNSPSTGSPSGGSPSGSGSGSPQGTTATPLSTSGGTPSTPAGSQQPAQTSSPTQAITSSVARQTVFAIHGRYHLLLGAGVASGWITHYNYTILTAQTPPAPPAPQPQCASTMNCLYVQGSQLHWQVFPTVDVVYLFKAQDPFPYSNRGVPGEYVPRVAYGLTAGFDIINPKQNFLIGGTAIVRMVNSSVLNGLGFKGGLMIGQSQHVPLPQNEVNQFIATPNPDILAVSEKWNVGAFVGLTISAVSFSTLFGAIFK